MNPQWEILWKQDLERRAVEALAPMERNRCLVDVYQAKVDAYMAIAERAGFNNDHPFVQEMAMHLPDMPAMKHPEFDVATIAIPSIDIASPSIPVLDIPDIQLQKP